MVDAVGVATGPRRARHRTARGAPPLDDVLITHHLHYSLPYRALFAQASLGDLWARCSTPWHELLARAHLAGVLLGRLLPVEHPVPPRRGALAAWLVDAETGELHDRCPTASAGTTWRSPR